MTIRRLLAVLVRRSTYQRWVYLILGGALVVPYLLVAAIAIPSIVPVALGEGAAVGVGGVVALLVMVATSFIPAVRVLEGTAIRELLDDPVPTAVFGPAATTEARLRSSAVFLLHVLAGALVSLLSLVLPVFFVLSLAGPFTGNLGVGTVNGIEVPRGWAGAWLPAAFGLSLILLIYLVAVTGALLTRAAAALLGTSAADRIAELERRADRLSERNRLARELHDSVGHALSVVTIQSGAARRTLRRDPELAERALLAIEDSARAALDDLDYVLGLLRDEPAARAPQSDLADMSALLDATRATGAVVEAEVRGDLSGVPPTVSREAYRILQECLTNALRHAGKVPIAVRLEAGGELLELSVTNRVESPEGRVRDRPRGGRGLRGVRERVEVLRGEVRAGRTDGLWEVLVRLPFGGHGVVGEKRVNGT
ncbi:Signal transduction histidine kinase [Amycolatopsis marina]|uniref:histidine kinase n=1 Tax=Amycolatopsis marina TaxID=490629 RepID=A0A1I0Z5Q7_9PSEU|nr:histidine kinase [Amycolatopsis marina]SFB20945.1 Signal transduction histidine kinase [Amycolatopsis marina]